MKKLISITLALVMCVCSMSFCISANAAQAKTVAITLKGTMYGGIVDAAVNSVNESREYYGLQTLTVDKNLTAIAEKRAAEIMLYADTTNDSRPDGSDITSLISDYGVYSDTIFGTMYDTDSSSLEYKISDFKYNYNSLQSIGVGVFGYKGSYAYYVVVSTKAPTAKATCTTRSQSYTVNVATSKFTKKYIEYTAKNGGRYSALSTKFYAGGVYSDYTTIPNAQLAYASSNSKVFKIKGYNGYAKKNGKFTVTSKLKDGTVICKDSRNYTGYNTVKPVIKSISTPKKGKLKITWTTNITDVEGYQIQYSTNKQFKKGNKTVIVKGKKSSAKTIAKLKSKKIYYVRIRGFINQGNGEKAYTNWSKAKNIKVK
ncbi:MAG: hypothetical protein IJI47_02620 [Eubacterium sp.]|nr:hypothetical protein [Eubacterium sp.]MBR0412445.1 hypothetical protein [Eubacterium sp.]